jgi:ABC-type nickel/cobalt efflux system permease component RcnA
MVPSASAVIVLLGAVQLGRVPFGAGLILAFGFGLAAALVGVGLGALVLSRRAQRLLDARQLGERVSNALAPAATVALLVVGAWLTWRAIGRLG